jgi:hypothetical protein
MVAFHNILLNDLPIFSGLPSSGVTPDAAHCALLKTPVHHANFVRLASASSQRAFSGALPVRTKG